MAAEDGPVQLPHKGHVQLSLRQGVQWLENDLTKEAIKLPSVSQRQACWQLDFDQDGSGFVH
eukprot:10542445-Lingulodinium_polyedra.AAC.1